MHYTQTSTNKEKFSLHDCRAKKIILNENSLTFIIPDGIFFDDYSDDWPNTWEAEVEYVIDEGVTFYFFDDKDWNEIRKKYTIEQVAEKVNSGEWELEFGYQYNGYHEIFHTGWIWQNHEPWSFECQMFIGTKTDAIFRWNSPA